MLNLNTLDDKQLDELEGKLNNETLTEEERKALTPEDAQDDNEGLIVEVDYDPEKPVDNSAPNPPASTDNQTPAPTTEPTDGVPPPAPVTPAISEEAYNALIAEHPQLAKFKNDENFITNLSKSYVNLESKIGSPQPPPPTLPPITDEQRLAQLNKDILSEVEKRMFSNPAVMDALTVRNDDGSVAEILQLPKTPQELYRFKREYPAEYLEVKAIGDGMYNSVHKEFLQNAQYEQQAPTANQDTLDKFMDEVVDYCKKIAPNATPADLNVVGKTLHGFVSKTIPDGKYYSKKGGAYFLDGRSLKADFLTENIELIGKLAEINAKNSVATNVQLNVANLQKGKSMKTLANANQNSPTRRTVDLKRDISRMSDAELDRLQLELLNK